MPNLQAEKKTCNYKIQLLERKHRQDNIDPTHLQITDNN